ncbi:hypothetical protein THAR02_10986 [Trichoderma harzianum]|uniref:Uncharacterized protein n=1 Tax=Trichoderma harzianum TaxID=5544 RepID=A0A0F9Z8J6_TRIHA|nr:hypothetical protein THAR02_10986 [Trichoderma harzianum]
MALEGMSPGACFADHKSLFEKIKSGSIFENFSVSQREQLWERVCSTSKKCLIPSLFTFFEDRKFLQDAAGAIRKVLDVNRTEKDKCVIQASETSFIQIAGDSDTRLALGIRQIWLAAFRNCREMPPDTQKRDLLALSRTKTDQTALYELSSLASQLGFKSDKLKELSCESIDRYIAENAMLKARKPGIYEFRDRDICIQQIVDVFHSAALVPTDKMADGKMETGRENGQSPNRYGRPNNADYEIDRTRLFLPQMSDDIDMEMGQMTSTFVRWSVYCAYFGRPSLELNLKEDDTVMLDIEHSECEKGRISQKGNNKPVSEGKEVSTTPHDPEPYSMSQTMQDMGVRYEQLRQRVTRKEQVLQDTLHQIDRNNTVLDGLSQKIQEEQAKLNETEQMTINETTKLSTLQRNVESKQSQLKNLSGLLAPAIQQSGELQPREKRDTCRSEHGTEFEQKAHDEQIAEFEQSKRAEYEAEIDKLDQELKTKFSNQKSMLEQSKRAEYEAEIDKLAQELKTKFANQKSMLEQSKRAEYKAEIDKLDQEWKNKYEEEKAKVRQQCKIEYNDQIAQLEQICETKHKAQIAQLQEERAIQDAKLHDIQERSFGSYRRRVALKERY